MTAKPVMQSSCLCVYLRDYRSVNGWWVPCSLYGQVCHSLRTHSLHCGAVCGPHQVRVEWGSPYKNTCCKQEVGL